jgi:uncharacterized protein (TIGR02600 family)
MKTNFLPSLRLRAEAIRSFFHCAPMRSFFNSHPNLPPFRVAAPRARGRRRGQALIIVLGFLALMVVIVVAFFVSVQTATVGSRVAAHGLSAQQLAQSAVQLVEGTITQATVPAMGDPTANSVAWACQPGMIRTYGNGAPGGYSASCNPLAYYKLYSSSQMIVPTSALGNYTVDASVTNTYGDILSNWDQVPALYTDLNAPTTASDGTTVFPIVDPRAGPGGLAVAGFSYNATGATASKSVASIDNVAGNGAAGSILPMPVQWIYVLKDGTLSSPDEPTSSPAPVSNVATFTRTGNPPTAQNPIVGRIAFWTDDECAKVNLNTASEGTYYDTPLANTGKSTDVFTGGSNGQTVALGDATFSVNQPAQYEFQRYPGHPATTCLSAVFGTALTSLARSNLVTAIDQATPRISDSASNGGSSTLGGTQNASAVLKPNFNRLYATVDEFNFTPTRTTQAVGNASTTQQLIEESRFFLTTSSKAPDLNPFGLPKITMWPVWDTSATGKIRSILDNEIVHCSTVANSAASGYQHSMIFTRADPTSPTTDWNLPRNTQLIGDLQTMLGRNIPGVGGSFATKYTSNNDLNQIIAEIFDYIRCTNLADQSATFPTPNTVYNNSYTPSFPPTSTINNAAVGQVVPSQPSAKYQGLGRVPLIGEMGIGLIKIDDRSNLGSAAQGATNRATSLKDTTSGTSISPANQTFVEWTIFPMFVCPSPGYPALGEDIRFHFTGLTGVTVGGKALSPTGNSPSGAGPFCDLFDTGRVATGQSRDSLIGGIIGPDVNMAGTGATAGSMYPTGLLAINGITGGTTTIAGTFQVQVFCPSGATNPIQTYTFTFPSMTVPIPAINIPSPGTTWQGTDRSCSAAPSGGTATSTFTYNANPGAIGRTIDTFFCTGNVGSSFTGMVNSDVVRTLSPATSPSGPATLAVSSANIDGDLRLIAASPTVPASAYQLTPKPPTGPGTQGSAPGSGDFMVSSMRAGPQISVAGGVQANGGQLVKGLSYDYSPAVPNSVTSALMTNDGNIAGDWDNGPGLMVDGPWTNKPDEGQGLSSTEPAGYLPYINDYQSTSTGSVSNVSSIFFSPNRQISSPVMFGSLPVGTDHPWRTLLFRPTVLPGYQGTYVHPGGISPSSATVPPDHWLLDFFRMPVVEPYSISEPLATSGKINLNTQIAPFTYITRTTGMNAVLKSVMITALNTTYGTNYKQGYINTSSNQGWTTRFAIDLSSSTANAGNTLNTINTATPDGNLFPEFNRKSYTWTAPNFFISPSQICDVPLVPLGASGSPAYTVATLNSFWAGNSLTGDNSLERPYSLIYPRVTTQSNTFTVHVRAQSLQKVPAGLEAPATWTEGLDQVAGEYRGSFTVEKYFDPSYAVVTDSNGNVLSDAQETSSTDAAVRGDNNNGGAAGGGALVHGALWRLLSSKRFGQ